MCCESPKGIHLVAGGNAPGNSHSPAPDPERVEEKPLSKQCLAHPDLPLRPLQGRWVGNPSGGVAPGYCLMPLQGIVLGRPTTSYPRGPSLFRVLTPGVQPKIRVTISPTGEGCSLTSKLLRFPAALVISLRSRMRTETRRCPRREPRPPARLALGTHAA